MEDPAGRVWERARRFPHYRELRAGAVLLSHAHMDHCGYISFLDPAIPVVCTAMTAYLAKAIQDAGAHQFEGEMCYAVPRIAGGDGTIGAAPAKDFPFERRPYRLADALPQDPYDFWNLSPSSERGRHFPASPLRTADEAAGLQVRFLPVDHSIYGAAAVAVRTSAGWVVYTGDLRRHGRHRALTDAFVRQARALGPAALLCEGTNIDRGPGASEEAVFEACLEAVRGAGGELVVADFGPRNVERLLAFLEIARRSGRRLAITDKDAYLLWAMHAVDPTIPTPAGEAALVVYRRALLRPDRWVELVREWFPGQVTAADVHSSPGEYILCFSFFDVTELVDIDPDGGIWIYLDLLVQRAAQRGAAVRAGPPAELAGSLPPAASGPGRGALPLPLLRPHQRARARRADPGGGPGPGHPGPHDPTTAFRRPAARRPCGAHPPRRRTPGVLMGPRRIIHKTAHQDTCMTIRRLTSLFGASPPA